MPSKRDAVTAAERASTPEEARSAVDVPVPKGGAGSQDPLVGDLRKGGLLPLLVLHFVAQEPCYGNQLIDRIGELTQGALTINPNTMYPLLRRLEAKGMIAGEWEHPERRSRRFYRITDAGTEHCAALRSEVEPRLQRIGRSIMAIRTELSA